MMFPENKTIPWYMEHHVWSSIYLRDRFRMKLCKMIFISYCMITAWQKSKRLYVTSTIS